MEHATSIDQYPHPQSTETEDVLSIATEQRLCLDEIESGFMDEMLDDGTTPRWEVPFPHGARDQNGDTWAFYYDSERKHQKDGWQLWKCPADSNEFLWTPISHATLTELSHGLSTVQLALRDSTNNDIVNVLFRGGEVKANHWFDAEAMQPLLLPAELRLGKHAVELAAA